MENRNNNKNFKNKNTTSKIKKENSYGVCAWRLNEDKEIEISLIKPVINNNDSWGFPKGRIEPGETEIEAALREFEEEAGNLELDYIFNRKFFQKNKHKNVSIWLGRLTENSEHNKQNIDETGKILKHDFENEEARFFPLNDLPKIFYSQKIILKHIKEYFKTQIIFIENIK